MKKISDVQTNEARPDDSPHSPGQKRVASGSPRAFDTALKILVVLLVFVSIIFLIRVLRTVDRVNPLESKMTVLEQRITGIEKQLAEIQGKLSVSNVTPDFDKRVEVPVDKAGDKAGEPTRQPPPLANLRARPVPIPGRAASAETQSLTVQEGDTLIRISERYGVSVETLRQLNNLSENQPIRLGQRLQILPRRQPQQERQVIVPESLGTNRIQEPQQDKSQQPPVP